MAGRDVVYFDPQRLSALAVKRELTRREIAAKGGVCVNSVWLAFAGRKLGVRAARAIARALGSTVAKLMADDSARHVSGDHKQSETATTKEAVPPK